MFIQQGGRNKHEHICEALELFAAKVMPVLKADQAGARREEAGRTRALHRGGAEAQEADGAGRASAIPTVSAYGRNVVQADQATEGPTHHVDADIAVMMTDVAEKKKKQAAE